MTTPTTATLPLLLKSLCLPSFAREYAVVAAQAAREGLSHAAYLLALAARAATERAARRVERLILDSKLPREKSLETFDLTRLPPKVCTTVAMLREGRFWIRPPMSSYSAIPAQARRISSAALDWSSCGSAAPCSLPPPARSSSGLLAAKRDLRLAAELKRLDRFEALILDDLEYVQQSREEMEVLFTLLAERYERRSVVITSNLVFSKWDQIFKDPMTTAAAVDRVVHHARILELPIPSYRAQAAQARSQAPHGAEGA